MKKHSIADNQTHFTKDKHFKGGSVEQTDICLTKTLTNIASLIKYRDERNTKNS